MNEELELALAYWRTMAPQPKAIVYAKAIEARLKRPASSSSTMSSTMPSAGTLHSQGRGA